VGAGLAGLRSVQELRKQGFDGEITVIGAEPHRPYDRPPLSKNLLLGRVEPDDIGLLTPEDEKTADWLLGRTVTAVEPAAVTLDDGERITANGIVLAAGARPRRLPLPDLPGVHTLRTVEDALALRAAIRPGARLTIVGAGLIGSEVAAAASTLGATVTVLEVDSEPFVRLFDPSAAALLRAEHAEHGVTIHPSTAVTDVGGAGRVEWAGLPDGTRLPTDVLLVSVGAVPNIEFLAGSPVACDRGVLTDEFGQTNVDRFVAVGDIARYRSAAGEPVRYEHWTNARDMPPTAIAALLAQLNGGAALPAAYDPVPYFWSDQYGHHIQLAGQVRPGDDIELLEGNLAERRFVLQHRRDGRPVAVVGWDSPRMFNRLRKSLRRSA